jgi:hypothetical protein
LFIMATVMLAAVPTHLFLLSHTFGPGVVSSNALLAWAGGTSGTILGGAAVVLLGLAATFVPLVLGLRAFRRLEA